MGTWGAGEAGEAEEETINYYCTGERPKGLAESLGLACATASPFAPTTNH